MGVGMLNVHAFQGHANFGQKAFQEEIHVHMLLQHLHPGKEETWVEDRDARELGEEKVEEGFVHPPWNQGWRPMGKKARTSGE